MIRLVQSPSKAQARRFFVAVVLRGAAVSYSKPKVDMTVAVLATSDSDLVPAVEFIISKGARVVKAGFPPTGVDLATACFASFDVFAKRAEIARPQF